MLVHAVQNGGSKLGTLLQNMLMQRRAMGSVRAIHKEFIISILTEIGSLKYTERSLLALQNDLENEIRLIELSTGKTNPKLWLILEMFRIA